MDLAGGHVNALDAIDSDARFQNLPSRGKYRAFNLGRGQGMSVLNMIEAMRKVTGWAYPYEIIGRRPGDVPDLTADPTLAEKELGFKAKHGLDEMARDLWNCRCREDSAVDAEGHETDCFLPCLPLCRAKQESQGLQPVKRHRIATGRRGSRGKRKHAIG